MLALRAGVVGLAVTGRRLTVRRAARGFIGLATAVALALAVHLARRADVRRGGGIVWLIVVGVVATIKPYETNVLLNDIIPQGKTGAMFQQKWGGWTFDYDNTAYAMYHSGEKWNPYEQDADLDKLLESQRAITDVAERERILKQIAHTVADKALEMPLYNSNAIYGVAKRVKNFPPASDNRPKLTEVTVD